MSLTWNGISAAVCAKGSTRQSRPWPHTTIALESGIHATIAGVLLALYMPLFQLTSALS